MTVTGSVSKVAAYSVFCYHRSMTITLELAGLSVVTAAESK